MATTKRFSLLHLLLPLSLLLLTATTISARPGIHFHPCNTLVISFETRSTNPNPNPNFLFPSLRPLYRFRRHFHHPSEITQLPFVDRTYEMIHLPLGFKDMDRPNEMTDLPLRKARTLSRPGEMTDLPFGFGSFRFQTKDQFRPSEFTEFTDLPFGFSSFRDRTKDILSVVASLLFGAACGALTAGTMYLVWSIVNYRHGDGNYRSFDGFSSDEDDDGDDDLFNPKKSHFVAIPAAPVKEKDAGDVKVAKETV